MTEVAPSGEQFEIRFEDQRATIVEVSGGMRAYAVAGRPVLDPYPVEGMCDGAHAAPLIAWPNRLGDGRYRLRRRRLPGGADRTRQAQRHPWAGALAVLARHRAHRRPGHDVDPGCHR